MAVVVLCAALLVASINPFTNFGQQLTDESDPSVLITDELIELAERAGVDVVDLAGAVATTKMEPLEYLYSTGELQRPPPPITGAMARADCIISKESGGRDVPNRQGSGATGPGQYFPSTWTRHTGLYRAATGYSGPLSLHSLTDVRRVMSFMLSSYPGSRSEWAVRGC